MKIKQEIKTVESLIKDAKIRINVYRICLRSPKIIKFQIPFLKKQIKNDQFLIKLIEKHLL